MGDPGGFDEVKITCSIHKEIEKRGRLRGVPGRNERSTEPWQCQTRLFSLFVIGLEGVACNGPGQRCQDRFYQIKVENGVLILFGQKNKEPEVPGHVWGVKYKIGGGGTRLNPEDQKILHGEREGYWGSSFKKERF